MASVVAGSGVTLVNVLLAELSVSPGRTGAGELAHQVNAGAAVLTRTPVTLVDVQLTLSPHVALGTLAVEAVEDV